MVRFEVIDKISHISLVHKILDRERNTIAFPIIIFLKRKN